MLAWHALASAPCAQTAALLGLQAGGATGGTRHGAQQAKRALTRGLHVQAHPRLLGVGAEAQRQRLADGVLPRLKRLLLQAPGTWNRGLSPGSDRGSIWNKRG